ncbi:hypothetical protein ASE27_03870 [Oerskovia sp. Root918]|uniref:hypothetical protein n=1 Tax=Oerskovia sp. Root918 TaxID=1736607 RepID=UPI0006F6ABDC|nr:hypothetical protein [Oerskovia sp. Root918]KRD47467.1 hypothetical protein ASE27_03870 [Oerskovia sp. Root918]
MTIEQPTVTSKTSSPDLSDREEHRSVPGQSGWDAFVAWEGRRRDGVVIAVALVVTSAVLALIPYLFFDRFYFSDDTQTGAYGIWVSIGEHLRAGEIPFFEPSRWMAGNYIVEGQWGTFNPLIMLLGLGASFAESMVLYATMVKVVALVLAAGGWYLLFRSYGANAVLGFLAGVLSTLSGFTVYIDAASWVTGLFVWALLPWAWWAIRRVVGKSGNPLLAFVTGYLVVTIGYVHGTIMLAVVIAATIVEAMIARRRVEALKVLLVGLLVGMVALAVYLPGLLSAPVTARNSAGILNDNFMSPDLSGLSTSWIATAQPWITGFWGLPTPGPIMYIAWLLPAVLFVQPRRARAALTGVAGLLIVGTIAALFVLGPSAVGPLRFPARLLPYLSVCLLGVVAVLLSRAAARPSVRRIVAVVVVVVVGAYFAFAEAPGSWKAYGAATFVALVGLVALGITLRRHGTVSGRRVLASGLVVTGVLTLLQHAVIPTSPLPDYGLPGERSAYSEQLSGVEGDVFVVGQPQSLAFPWDEVLFANLWYLNDASVQNVYTPVMFRTYAEDLCVSAHGSSCWESLDTLFGVDPATSVPLVDLLSINAVQIVRRDDGGANDPFANAVPPAGWHVRDQGLATVVWERDLAVDTAGGVVWSSEGVQLSDIEVTPTAVTFTVQEIPEGGGSVVMSRLAWPGYSVTGGARLDDPVRDYLLTLEVPATATGERVTVTFTPPGWGFGRAALVGSVGVVLVWSLVEFVGGVRRRAHRQVGP